MRLTRSLQVLGALVTIFLALTAFTPLVNVLSYWRAPARALEKRDAIVVLGGGGIGEDGQLGDVSMRRTMEAVDLYRQGLAPTVAVSGFTSGETLGRARLARANGVSPEAILALPAARTTREEAIAARTVLWPRGVRRIILVTDGPSMPRSLGAFEKVGFLVTPSYGVPVLRWGGGPGARLGRMRETVIELMAALYYRIRGWV